MMRCLCALALACLVVLVGCSEDAKTTVRGSLNDYSWSELSAISSEIAAASNDSAAMEVARRYNLASADGKLDGTQSKEVVLADGALAHVTVAGFNHDERVGGGKAGITFIFQEAVSLHGMNNIGIETDLSELGGVYGGWPASELRGWLGNGFLQELLADLRAQLVDVAKSSCVVSQEETFGTDAIDQSIESLVEQITDKLWIPSLVEITGVSESAAAAEDSPEWTAPLRAEGSQYQLFRDCGVVEDKPNGILVRSALGDGNTPCRWWLRSVEDITFCDVRVDGSVQRREDVVGAGDAQGVVPCFAL